MLLGTSILVAYYVMYDISIRCSGSMTSLRAKRSTPIFGVTAHRATFLDDVSMNRDKPILLKARSKVLCFAVILLPQSLADMHIAQVLINGGG